jgi:hypothetical protein
MVVGVSVGSPGVWLGNVGNAGSGGRGVMGGHVVVRSC